MRTVAIIPAGGSGKRLGGDIRKQYLMLGGIPLLAQTLAIFQSSPVIDEIILVAPEEDLNFVRGKIVDLYQVSKVSALVAGGKERQDSVGNGLRAIAGTCDVVVVSDGVRPFVTGEMIEKVVEAAFRRGAACIGVRAKDTIKETSAGDVVKATLPRFQLWQAQTPQAFQYDLLVRAYENAGKDGYYGTDDASLVERTGVDVMMIEGAYSNMKITTPDDLVLAEALMGTKMKKEISYRSAIGYDSHRFASGRKLILGGVEIPYDLGLAGHSDADALLHAVCDALLGMAALGDIGRHFPDNDDAYKGISSIVLLEKVKTMVETRGIVIHHIDATVLMEKPKLAPYAAKMAANIAGVLNLDLSAVSIKAKTNEGMGFVGRGEGVAVMAIATGSERIENG